MNIIGQFPAVLYRAFKKREYAEQFLNGYIRFGTVLSYTKIEDEKRRDKTEGTGHYTREGIDTKIRFCSNVFYALCFHSSLDAALKSQFGSFVVEVFDPAKIAKDITKVISVSPAKHYGGVEGVEVVYNKGEENVSDLSSYEKSKLTYSQKPKSFSPEQEFRFVYCRKEYAGDNQIIKLNQGVSGIIQEY